ncbi:glycosyltransferase family 2 protein [Devosia riboflavina]
MKTGRNDGYAAAINAATATLASNAALLVLNPDIRLLPGSIDRLLRRTIEPDVGVVVPQMRDPDGTIAMSLRREPSLLRMWAQALLGPVQAARIGLGEMIADPGAYQKSRDVDWATGAALLVSPQARARIGTWDESFFLYSEEVDYQRRVRASGLRVVYEPSACVTHIGGDYMQSPMLAALMTRNQIRYFRRHHGRAETVLFRGAIAAFGLLRAWRSDTHRAILRAALMPVGLWRKC